MAFCIHGGLRRLDTRDNHERPLEPGQYKYQLVAGGGGRLGFKVCCFEPPRLGEPPTGRWIPVEQVCRVPSGTVCEGVLTIPSMIISDRGDPASQTRTRFHFVRGTGIQGVEYDLQLERVR